MTLLSNLYGAAMPLALLLWLLLTLAGCATPDSVQSQRGGPTAGGLAVTDGTRLWIVRPDVPGTGQHEVARAGERRQIADPAWSPDGRHIAYSYDQLPGNGTTYGADIYVVEADGRGPRALFTHDTVGGFARSPVWSPDGAFLYFSYAFTIKRPGQPMAERVQQLMRVEIATGALTPISENAHLPTISPDGTQLAFVRYAANINEAPTLWIARADGQDARPLVPTDWFKAVWAPRFSPDGTHILIMAHSSEPARPRLTVQRPRATYASWPPLVAAHGYPMDLWLVEVATGRVELLAALGADDLQAVWSPDGRRIACLSVDGLSILDLTTAALTPLPTVPQAFGGLDWSR